MDHGCWLGVKALDHFLFIKPINELQVVEWNTKAINQIELKRRREGGEFKKSLNVLVINFHERR